MKFLSNHLRGAASKDSGESLIEVMVAMFIFALIAAGVASSLVSTLNLSAEARAKQTAANIAAQTIDSARAIKDVVNGFSALPTSATVDGMVYKITTATGWVGANSSSVSSTQCSTGSGALIARYVHVAVTWPGMTAGTPVTADTIVSPTSRLTSIALGIIVISVKNAAGVGYPGVTIKALTDPGGAAAISGTIAPTDANGCGLILGVAPGNYIISITKTTGGVSSIDNKQVTVPTASKSVVAGSSVTAAFVYDQPANYSVSYHGDFNPTPAVTVTMPQTMQTTFVNTAGMWVRSATTNTTFALHPFGDGYQVIAGTLGGNGGLAVSCSSVDPGTWPTVTQPDGSILKAQPAQAVSPGPGGTASVVARMGIFTVSGLGGKYLLASPQAAGPSGSGDPGCASGTSYLFKVPAGVSATLALPFGSWVFASGTTASPVPTTPVTSVGTPIATVTQGEVSSDSVPVLTLDPRLKVLP